MNTSEYLRIYLKHFDDDFEKEQPSQTPEEKEWLITFRKLEIDSIESVLPADLAKLIHEVHSGRDTLEFVLDDYYSRHFLDEVPKIVKRALKLEPLFTKQSIEGSVETYIREATRAYLFGLFQASIALTRSALEQSLKENLRAQDPMLAQTDELLSLLKGAELSKSLDGSLLQFAHEVRKSANTVLHGTPCGDQAAFDMLIKARKVIDALYSGRK